MGIVDEAVVGASRAIIFSVTYALAVIGLFAGWTVVFIFVSQYVQLPVITVGAKYGFAEMVFGVPFAYPVAFTAVSVGLLFRALFPSLLG